MVDVGIEDATDSLLRDKIATCLELWLIVSIPRTTTKSHIFTMPSLRLGSIAPDFEAETTAGPIKFHEWIGQSWVCLMISPSIEVLSKLLILGNSVFASWRFYTCLHD